MTMHAKCGHTAITGRRWLRTRQYHRKLTHAALPTANQARTFPTTLLKVNISHFSYSDGLQMVGRGYYAASPHNDTFRRFPGPNPSQTHACTKSKLTDSFCVHRQHQNARQGQGVRASVQVRCFEGVRSKDEVEVCHWNLGLRMTCPSNCRSSRMSS